jgi:hypothetical protein
MCKVERVGNTESCAVIFKRFDPEDGKELDPERNYFTVREMEAKKLELTNQLAAAQQILDAAKSL